MQTPSFWLAVGKIIWINVLLSGDNALVIAMACRGLHGRHRLWGMIIGAGIAVVLLIAFTGVVATLMALPYLKLVRWHRAARDCRQASGARRRER